MPSEINPVAIRIQHFRNILDTGWIDLRRINAVVGLNESGKSSLLHATHKFNPWEGTPTDNYDVDRDFPRHHPDHDLVGTSEVPDWPVCTIQFQPRSNLRRAVTKITGSLARPDQLEVTRSYSGAYTVTAGHKALSKRYTHTEIRIALLMLGTQVTLLREDASLDPEVVQTLKSAINHHQQTLEQTFPDDTALHTAEGSVAIATALSDITEHADSLPEEDFTAFRERLQRVIPSLSNDPPASALHDFMLSNLPKCVFFDEMPLITGTVDLSDFSSAKADPSSFPSLRPEHAMAEIGDVDADVFTGQARGQNQRLNLNLRSRAIQHTTRRVSGNFSSTSPFPGHTFRYDERSNQLTIQVSDQSHPTVETDIEERSKGFQTYLSFHALMLDRAGLVPSGALLLLDEPGLHLHPTAQRSFVESLKSLSERHTIMYTTHSPYMFDRNSIADVKMMVDNNEGFATVVTGRWPEDVQELFPIDEAIGFELRGDMIKRANALLVEGKSDKIYLDGLRTLTERLGRNSLAEEATIVGCFGASTVRSVARIFEARGKLPAVLLDADRAGDDAYNKLTDTIYEHHRSRVMKLLVPDSHGDKPFEIEDFVGEDAVVGALRQLLGLQPHEFEIKRETNDRRSITQLIEKTAESAELDLPGGPGAWKVEVAKQVVRVWESSEGDVPDVLLDQAVSLFERINPRLEAEP